MQVQASTADSKLTLIVSHFSMIACVYLYFFICFILRAYYFVVSCLFLSNYFKPAQYILGQVFHEVFIAQKFNLQNNNTDRPMSAIFLKETYIIHVRVAISVFIGNKF